MEHQSTRDAEEVRVAEMRDHRTGKVTGYIPLSVLAEMGIGFQEGRTTWFKAEQVEAIRRHPEYQAARIDGGIADGS